MKVRLAEAELRRTRLTLAQKVLELRAVVDSHREVVKATQEEYEMYVALRRANSVPESDIRRLSAQLKKAKAELAQAEAGLNGLVGAIPGQPGLAPAGTSGPRTAGGTEPSVSRAPSGPTAQ
jgi:outer membrane protein TolC